MKDLETAVSEILPQYISLRKRQLGWKNCESKVEVKDEVVQVELYFTTEGSTKDHREVFSVARGYKGRIDARAEYFTWQPIIQLEEMIKA